jgi:excisionase family DNA binding protein
MIKDRVTVQEAAKRLGVKDDAIRKRIQRGTLEHDKDPDGRVYVYLDAPQDESYDGQSGAKTQTTSQDATQDAIVVAKDETISELRDQVDFLRRELERKDAILMSLTQRVPELEAPARKSAPSQTHEKAAGGPSEDGEWVRRHTRRSGVPERLWCQGEIMVQEVIRWLKRVERCTTGKALRRVPQGRIRRPRQQLV